MRRILRKAIPLAGLAALGIAAVSVLLLIRSRPLDEKCGPESLFSLLRFEGQKTTIKSVEEDFPRRGDDSTFNEIVAAASKHGLRLIGVKTTPDDLGLRQAQGILAVRPQHFVALLQSSPGRYVIEDLQTSDFPIVWNRDQLDRNWLGPPYWSFHLSTSLRRPIRPSSLHARKVLCFELLDGQVCRFGHAVYGDDRGCFVDSKSFGEREIAAHHLTRLLLVRALRHSQRASYFLRRCSVVRIQWNEGM